MVQFMLGVLVGGIIGAIVCACCKMAASDKTHPTRENGEHNDLRKQH